MRTAWGKRGVLEAHTWTLPMCALDGLNHEKITGKFSPSVGCAHRSSASVWSSASVPSASGLTATLGKLLEARRAWAWWLGAPHLAASLCYSRRAGPASVGSRNPIVTRQSWSQSCINTRKTHLNGPKHETQRRNVTDSRSRYFLKLNLLWPF